MQLCGRGGPQVNAVRQRWCFESLFAKKLERISHFVKPPGFFACYASYRCLFAIFGSTSNTHRPRWRRIIKTSSSWCMRSLFVSCFGLDVYQNIVYLCQVFFKGTFLTIVEFLYYLTLNILELESAYIIIFHVPKFDGMFVRGDEKTRSFFSMRAFVVGIALSIPLTVKAVYDFLMTVETLDSFTSIVYLSSIFVFFAQVPAFIFYLQCLEIIRSEQDTIREAVQSESYLISSNSIIKRKRRIRRMLEKVNGVFRRFVIVKFVSIFCGVTMQVGLSIGDSAEDDLVDTLSGIVLDAALKLVEVYVICHSGTFIERICHETERCLHGKTLLMTTREAIILQTLRRELAFEADRDSLEMSLKFRINTATLLSFFSTVITCCAVTLQFDSRVVQAINKAGASARKQ
ncbi:uncharacterized protein LOC114828629 [Galendromus occidentalis]|uniref:Uncharacterized protein LOC114828629 n=1 Tax=Galendromus occidentalis TaxID=34638 RepID=A0AAJ7SIB2_9ACAR|nr:uncharacterized protein LOC114828629 [Galendromus occidentalis]